MAEPTGTLNTAPDTSVETRELDDVIRQLRKNTRSRKHRSHERRDWCCRMKAVLREAGGVQHDRRTVAVKGIDLSQGGCALGINRYVARDSTLLLILPLPDAPIVEGRVCYCELISGRLHRIGVQFIRLYTGKC